ncbi:MAG TPA: methyltransferase domain-containing protein [Xanthobacteraceae bacterium]|nr:methyltransferase domain-containing protein [Xanthobacteraceae bacterium]
MRPQVPPYFDLLVDGFKAGRTGRHVHLGYWDAAPAPAAPCTAGEFEAAQARLCEIFIALADLHDRQSVVDVGCGFGGTLAAINDRWQSMRLTGLNIDRRQLDICRTLNPRATNTLSFALADACAMPLRPACLDRMLCLEAMFHFRSRSIFLAQAAQALRPGGRLALSDILLKHPGDRAPLDIALLEQTLRREYGPWPQLWISTDQILESARDSGLVLDRIIETTDQTLPTYRMTAPDDQDALPSRPAAGSLMRWLHREGYLSYLCLAFTKA